MKITKPSGSIPRQAQTTTPINSDATLVDDPVALVDSPTALSGGPVTSIPATRQTIHIPKPVATIKIRR